MKIKFIRPFRFIGNNPDDGSDSAVPVGHVVDLENDESTRWLIDNGFAEKVDDTKGGWKPEIDGTYYCVLSSPSMFTCDTVGRQSWKDDDDDQYRYSIGNVFKTEKSARRFIDYLKAVETVRHDEGFMKHSRKIDYTPCGYTVYRSYDKSIITEASDMSTTAGEFYFDTHEHAKASIEKHRDEWQTILDYDWSKGEDSNEN